MSSIDSLIDAIFEREGGYSNLPDDRGGPTNFGITQTTLAKWRGQAVTAADVRALTRDEARAIYRKLYFDDAGLAAFPEALQAQAFDINVNGGLQACVGRLVPRFAPSLAALVEQHGPDAANVLLAASRVEYFARICDSRPTQAVFLRGWLRRARAFMFQQGS